VPTEEKAKSAGNGEGYGERRAEKFDSHDGTRKRGFCRPGKDGHKAHGGEQSRILVSDQGKTVA
jgi:hypothetical protein